MTINELLEKEEYKVFKLMSADYDKSSDITTITFLYSDFDKPSDELKNKLRLDIQSMLGGLTKKYCKV